MQGHLWSVGEQVNPQPLPDLQGDTCSDALLITSGPVAPAMMHKLVWVESGRRLTLP